VALVMCTHSSMKQKCGRFSVLNVMGSVNTIMCDSFQGLCVGCVILVTHCPVIILKGLFTLYIYEVWPESSENDFITQFIMLH
jgi:hypothetical protein